MFGIQGDRELAEIPHWCRSVFQGRRRASISMKLKDDDIAHVDIQKQPPKLLRWRRFLVLFVCPAATIGLIVCMILDALPSSPSQGYNQHLQMAERTLETMEELGTDLATGRWPVSRAYGKLPCAINITGYDCPSGYGAAMNSLYLLEQGSDSNSAPVYRSAEGYWLVHSPHACFTRATWLISMTRPDESADSHQCEIEANLWSDAALPVGHLQWSYVSCGAAGDSGVSHRWLMLKPVKKCDCPTAGQTPISESETTVDVA